MAYNEVAWRYPQYSSYSILNAAVNPAICWNPLQNNPYIALFEVDYLDVENKLWTNIGRSATNYIRFPSDNYTGQATYQIRIATIGINGIRSPYAYSKVAFSSPLSCDFTTNQTVRLINGTEVPNQRYLFLIL
jgi:hypothetical protein